MTASCSVNKSRQLPEVYILSGKADTGIGYQLFCLPENEGFIQEVRQEELV